MSMLILVDCNADSIQGKVADGEAKGSYTSAIFPAIPSARLYFRFQNGEVKI